MEPEERAALAKPSVTPSRVKSATVVEEPPVPEAAAIDGVQQVRRRCAERGFGKGTSERAPGLKQRRRSCGLAKLWRFFERWASMASERQPSKWTRTPFARACASLEVLLELVVGLRWHFDAHQADGRHKALGDEGRWCLHSIHDQEDSGGNKVLRAGGLHQSKPTDWERCLASCAERQSSENVGVRPEPRQAPRPPLAMLFGLEQHVVQKLNPPVLHCYAWWKLVSCWGTLRYDDRGFEPTKLNLNGKGALVMMTKTTSNDKKAGCRLLVVDGEAYLAEAMWLSVGPSLWKETAPWEICS